MHDVRRIGAIDVDCGGGGGGGGGGGAGGVGHLVVVHFGRTSATAFVCVRKRCDGVIVMVVVVMVVIVVVLVVLVDVHLSGCIGSRFVGRSTTGQRQRRRR